MSESNRRGLNGEGTAIEDWAKTTLMPRHDPMCPQVARNYPLTHCLCSLVAEVRLSECERIATDIEAYADDLPGGYGSLHAAVLIARGAEVAR